MYVKNKFSLCFNLVYYAVFYYSWSPDTSVGLGLACLASSLSLNSAWGKIFFLSVRKFLGTQPFIFSLPSAGDYWNSVDRTGIFILSSLFWCTILESFYVTRSEMHSLVCREGQIWRMCTTIYENKFHSWQLQVNTILILINTPALINAPCLFSENSVILACMNSCLLLWFR